MIKSFSNPTSAKQFSKNKTKEYTNSVAVFSNLFFLTLTIYFYVKQ